MRSEGKTKTRKTRQKILAVVQMKEDSGWAWECWRGLRDVNLQQGSVCSRHTGIVPARNQSAVFASDSHGIPKPQTDGQEGSLHVTWAFFFRGSDRWGHLIPKPPNQMR